MEKCVLYLVAVGAIASSIGCHKPILLTSSGTPEIIAKKGETLKWELLPTTDNIEGFDIVFLAKNPCGDNVKPHGTTTAMAKCQVIVGNRDGLRVAYPYVVAITKGDDQAINRNSHGKGKFGEPGGGGSCYHCPGASAYAGSSIMNEQAQVLKSSSIAAADNVYVKCNKGFSFSTTEQPISVTAGTTPNPGAIEWQDSSDDPEWTITFDRNNTPCTNNIYQLTPNQTCTIKPGVMKDDTFTYWISSKDNVCTETKNQTVVIK